VLVEKIRKAIADAEEFVRRELFDMPGELGVRQERLVGDLINENLGHGGYDLSYRPQPRCEVNL
jgi:hypothetical protein